MKRLYKSLSEIPDEIVRAYDKGEYRFNPPPVYSGNWDKVAWINWVWFDKEIEKLREKEEKGNE